MAFTFFLTLNSRNENSFPYLCDCIKVSLPVFPMLRYKGKGREIVSSTVYQTFASAPKRVIFQDWNNL